MTEQGRLLNEQVVADRIRYITGADIPENIVDQLLEDEPFKLLMDEIQTKVVEHIKEYVECQITVFQSGCPHPPSELETKATNRSDIHEGRCKLCGLKCNIRFGSNAY